MTMVSRKAFSGAAVAGLLLAAAQAQAQQDRQALSAEEVKSFLEESEKALTQMVQAGEYARLDEWTGANFADGATFLVTLDLEVGEERKGFAVLSLDKQDVTRLGHLAVGALAKMPEAVQDYELDIEATRVDPIGPDAAKATTRITESGKLALAGGAAAQSAQSEPVEFEATARCEHLIQRDTDRLVIGMTTCRARMQL